MSDACAGFTMLILKRSSTQRFAVNLPEWTLQAAVMGNTFIPDINHHKVPCGRVAGSRLQPFNQLGSCGILNVQV